MPAFSHDIKELVLSGINVALEHGAQLLKPCFAVSSFYCRLVRSCHTSAKNAGRRTSCCFSAFMNILYSHTQILFIHTWTTSPTLYLSFHNVNEQTTICRLNVDSYVQILLNTQTGHLLLLFQTPAWEQPHAIASDLSKVQSSMHNPRLLVDPAHPQGQEL